MPFQSVSPEARKSEPYKISDDDFTSSDEPFALIPRQHASSTASQPTDNPVWTRSPRPGSAHSMASRPSTPRPGVGILKGTGPELQPGLARRAKPGVTYNIKELSDKTRASSKSSPNKTLLQAQKNNPVDPGPRRQRSEPPTYNLQELVRQASGKSKTKRRRAKKILKQQYKQKQKAEEALKRAAGGDGADDGPSAKRRRLEKDSSYDPNAVDAVQPVGRNPASTGAKDLIKYLTPILRKGQVSDPRATIDSSTVHSDLSVLPQQRAIEWNPSRAATKPWMFRGSIDITALLIQVTGDLAPAACTNCRGKRGLFTSCVLLSRKATPGNIYGCANCVYHGKQTYCSYKNWGRKGPPKNSAPSHVLKHKVQAKENHNTTSTDAGVETGAQESESATQDTAGRVTRFNAVNRRVATEEATTQSTAKNTSLATVGRPAESLTMEPWEKAPGQIRSRVPDSVGSESACFFFRILPIS